MESAETRLAIANSTSPKRELELAMDEAEQLTKRGKYTMKTTVIDDDDFQQPAHKRFIAEKIFEKSDTPLADMLSIEEQIDPSMEVDAQPAEPEKVKRVPKIYVGSRT